MSVKHTPGPWRRDGTHIQAGSEEAGDFRYVADCWDTDGLETQTQTANAQLIAAAPAMEEALKVLLASLARRDEHLSRVRTDAVLQARVALELAEVKP